MHALLFSICDEPRSGFSEVLIAQNPECDVPGSRIGLETKDSTAELKQNTLRRVVLGAPRTTEIRSPVSGMIDLVST